MTAPETWTLVLEVKPGPTPAAVRVRHLLKRALREYGIRCVAARDRLPADPADGVFDVHPPPSPPDPSPEAAGADPAD